MLLPPPAPPSEKVGDAVLDAPPPPAAAPTDGRVSKNTSHACCLGLCTSCFASCAAPDESIGGRDTKHPVFLLARLYFDSFPGERKYRWQGNCRVAVPSLQSGPKSTDQMHIMSAEPLKCLTSQALLEHAPCCCCCCCQKLTPVCRSGFFMPHDSMTERQQHCKQATRHTHPAAGCQKPTSVCMGATLAPGQAAPARLGLSRRSSGTLAVRRLMTASGAEMRPSRCCRATAGAGGKGGA